VTNPDPSGSVFNEMTTTPYHGTMLLLASSDDASQILGSNEITPIGRRDMRS
jgi:hypothetical protein